MKIELGIVARDKITGLEGVVVATTVWLNNCDTIALQPRTTTEGKPADVCSFDIHNLEFVGPTDLKVWPLSRPEEDVNTGDQVRCRITGIDGIVLGRTAWMNGCSRITIQPRELVKGKPADMCTIDETDLLIVERAVLAPKPPMASEEQRPGGPMPDPARR